MKKLWNFFASICTILFIISCSENQGHLLLVNKSEDTILKATVSVFDQLMEFDNIISGDSVTVDYEIGYDGYYLIDIEFKSGHKLQKELGYVTSGLNFKHKISVTDTDIQIEETEVSVDPFPLSQ